ncbi:MAG: winged helix-turn-helix domain-containing protein [Hylemonella sp.]|uniref:winged helix-turn-helix domain-containing protein n=1 Tax=Hylemonella sp. TaxID=2066020 RepID=UPI00391CC5A8
MHITGPDRHYCFDRFELRVGERRLLCDGQDVGLGGRAFELLLVLLEHAGQLLSKDDLLERVWRGLVVEEANLHVQVSQLRRVIGAQAIATLPGRGYKFTRPVQAHAGAPHRLSVMVLPFVETGASDAGRLAEALADQITAGLSRMQTTHVVDSKAVRANWNDAVDLRVLALGLGLRYAVQGRIAHAATHVEVGVRLTDATTGGVLWADTLRMESGEPGALRRVMTARVLNALTLELLKAEGRRGQAALEAGPASRDTEGLLLQAGVRARTARNAEDLRAALDLIDQASARQPQDHSLLAYRTRVLATLIAMWPPADIDAQIARAEHDICAALAQGSTNAHVYCTLSRVRQLQLRMGAALAAVDQALELEPDFAEAVAWRGALLVFTGRPQQALAVLQQALTLAPQDPHRWGVLFWLGKAHLMQGRYEEAVPWLERSAALAPFWATQAFLVAAYAHLERPAEMQAALATLQQQRGHGARLSNEPAYCQQRREHYLAGLLKAGAIPDLAAAA